MRWLLLIPLVFGAVVMAQEDDENAVCRAVLNASIASMQTECAEQLDLSVCYGSIAANLRFAQNLEDATFGKPGDAVGLSLIDALIVGGADIDEGEWGIARVQVRVNFTEDILPMWVLGDVTIENTGEVEANVPSAMLQVVFPEGANVRSAPDAEAEQIGVIYVGNSIRATGITRDGAWVRVQTEESETGWVTSVAFRSEDLNPLVTVPVEDSPVYGSMQAFTLETGENDVDCDIVPPNGVLIQSPEGIETANLLVNEVEVQIPAGVTVFLSAPEGDTLRLDVIEGEASLTAINTITVEEGDMALVRENEAPIPRAYDYDLLSTLPVRSLPRPIYVALDFSTLVRPAPTNGGNPLEGIEASDACTIAATVGPANMREIPSAGGRVRHVMQVGESALVVARAQGLDGALWWKIADHVWISVGGNRRSV